MRAENNTNCRTGACRASPGIEDPIARAENNTAERSPRPTAIAHRLSFGSQSPRGARPRETIVTVLGALQLPTRHPVAIVRHALDVVALPPERAPGIGSILFNEPAAISA